MINFYKLASMYRKYRIQKKCIRLREKYQKAQARCNSKQTQGSYVHISKIKRVFDLKMTKFMLKRHYVHPVQKNKVVFMAYQGGQYACNPKCISEYLQEKYPGKFEIVWMFEEPVKFRKLKEKGIRLVQYGGKNHYKELMTANVFVYNMRIPEMIPFRKSQTTISTGHGGGAYKHLLLDIPGLTKKDIIPINMSTANTDVYVSTNKRYTECVVRRAYGHKGEVLECGMPRNDRLIKVQEEVGVPVGVPAGHSEGYGDRKFAVHDYYGIPRDTKFILYAPTYRKGKGRKQAADYHLDTEGLKKAAEARFGGKWEVIYRLHHFVKSSFSYGAAKRGIIDATKYPDMQELLMESDILITDYSSSVWDFTLTGKPGFMYATDLEDYTYNIGFYTPVDQWPFYLTRNNKELIEAIENFDSEDYQKRVNRHLTELGNEDKGHATEIIGEYIYNKCFGN